MNTFLVASPPQSHEVVNDGAGLSLNEWYPEYLVLTADNHSAAKWKAFKYLRWDSYGSHPLTGSRCEIYKEENYGPFGGWQVHPDDAKLIVMECPDCENSGVMVGGIACDCLCEEMI